MKKKKWLLEAQLISGKGVNQVKVGELMGDFPKILGADIECYIDKITEEHLILASVPEDLAELADELHDCSSIKSFKAINISDCKTTVDIAEKIINRNDIIEIAVF